MNKKKVDSYLERAREALETSGIAKNGNIDKSYRGQISTFGAAITMGSLQSAVAFFCDKGGSSTERPLLMRSVCYVINIDPAKKKVNEYENDALYRYVADKNGDISRKKEDIVNASIALKLAMNLFNLTE